MVFIIGKRKTHEEFVQEVYNLWKDEYEVLSKYLGTNNKIKIRHNICGYEYKVTPNIFLNLNTKCPKCSGKMKKNTEYFKQEVYNLVKNEYTVLGKYKNKQTTIEIKHNICGHEYYVTPNHFLRGRRCPKCSIKNKPQCIPKTTNQFKQEIFDLVGDEYTILSKYKNCKTKILMKHNICRNEYEVRPRDFLRGNRCPYCKRSKGEEEISSLLDELGYKYETQVSFSDCKYKALLKFDFKIFLKDGSFILLEYNGKQHYENTFGYQEDFEIQQIRDQIKMNYCKKKGISLYIIRYDEDIKEKLKKILKQLNK